jgi:hypothetical protein
VSGSLDRTLRVWDLTGTKKVVEGLIAPPKDGDKGYGVCQSTLNGHKDPDTKHFPSGEKATLRVNKPLDNLIQI